MPITEHTPVKQLKIDLSNYRTVKQKNEVHAVEAIIAINPDWFWALTESLLDTGYLPTENILVLQDTNARASLVVKEGNRRISALKLIHGYIPLTGLQMPQNIVTRIAEVTPAWKKANRTIPCVIYAPEEVDIVNRIRSLTHGKGEKAGRDGWTAVARARHNRDENGVSEPALDLLEKYLVDGKNLTEKQAQRWAGDYRLTVLAEAMKKMATRVGATNSPDLGRLYPKIKHRAEFESIVFDIGQEIISFDSIRTRDIAGEYGIPADPVKNNGLVKGGGGAAGNGNATGGPGSSGGGKGTQTASAHANASGAKTIAVAIHDPKQVARTLKKFAPRGANREKVASLLIEIKHLKLDKNPIAFCFLLRSMFEISAKAYCTDHKAAGLSATKDGKDRKLVDVLKDVTRHLTANNQNQEVQKKLHGALTEMAKSDGVLSITSMNQLIHNPKFAHQASDIAILFGNIFPLLEAMNS